MLMLGQVTVQPTILLQLFKVEEIVQIVAHISHIGGRALLCYMQYMTAKLAISSSQTKERYADAGGSWQVRQLF
jgi:hypothetical protein